MVISWPASPEDADHPQTHWEDNIEEASWKSKTTGKQESSTAQDQQSLKRKNMKERDNEAYQIGENEAAKWVINKLIKQF